MMKKETNKVPIRRCSTCTYLIKKEQWRNQSQCKIIHSCKKGMIRIPDDVVVADLNTKSCGYYVERVENEQLSLFF